MSQHDDRSAHGHAEPEEGDPEDAEDGERRLFHGGPERSDEDRRQAIADHQGREVEQVESLPGCALEVHRRSPAHDAVPSRRSQLITTSPIPHWTGHATASIRPTRFVQGIDAVPRRLFGRHRHPGRPDHPESDQRGDGQTHAQPHRERGIIRGRPVADRRSQQGAQEPGKSEQRPETIADPGISRRLAGKPADQEQETDRSP